MPKLSLLGLAIALALPLVAGAKAPAGRGVQVVANEAQRRVDITMDGQPFTSYLWPTSLKKPVLFPLVAPGGITVTRGYPLAPLPGERVDHPHHAGMWFNYGNVNGFDFWNNSDAIPEKDRAKMGTIHHTRIVAIKSGAQRGELTVESEWIDGANRPTFEETTRFVFTRRADARVIDRITTLKALVPIVFHDDKEGLMGIRVAHWLESANEKGGVFNDANGRPTKVEGPVAPGATGVYRTSEGKEGEAVWSTRGQWCTLTGTNPDGKVATLAIVNHPNNPGAEPPFWHARGYGLFAVNPFGQHVFSPSAPELNSSLKQGESWTFRYRVLLMGQAVTAEAMNREAERFNADYR